MKPTRTSRGRVVVVMLVLKDEHGVNLDFGEQPLRVQVGLKVRMHCDQL